MSDIIIFNYSSKSKISLRFKDFEVFSKFLQKILKEENKAKIFFKKSYYIKNFEEIKDYIFNKEKLLRQKLEHSLLNFKKYNVDILFVLTSKNLITFLFNLQIFFGKYIDIVKLLGTLNKIKIRKIEIETKNYKVGLILPYLFSTLLVKQQKKENEEDVLEFVIKILHDLMLTYKIYRVFGEVDFFYLEELKIPSFTFIFDYQK